MNPSHQFHAYTKSPHEIGYVATPRKICILKSGRNAYSPGIIPITNLLHAQLNEAGFTIVSDFSPVLDRIFLVNQAEVLLTSFGATHSIHSMMWGGNSQENRFACGPHQNRDTKGEEAKKTKKMTDFFVNKEGEEADDRPPLRYIVLLEKRYYAEWDLFARAWQHRLYMEDGLMVAVTNESTLAPRNTWVKYINLGNIKAHLLAQHLTPRHLRFTQEDCYLHLATNKTQDVNDTRPLIQRPGGVYHPGTKGTHDHDTS